MTALYTVTQIRAIEHAALQTLATGTLMQRAGQAAATLALKLIAVAPTQARILVLAGPGNNGGDALEAAYRLALAGSQVSIVHAASPAPLSAEADSALQRAQHSAAVFLDPAHIAEFCNTGVQGGDVRHWDLLIDGLFGIGLSRPIGGALRQLVQYANQLACPVLALDIPSGLDADTGTIVGQVVDQRVEQSLDTNPTAPDCTGIAIRASHCITFIADKPGLHTGDGRDHAGIVVVADLDIEQRHFPPCQIHLNQPTLFQHHLQPRAHNSHKGSYGSVAVIGGATGMTGAMILAARAALHCGAGRVYGGFVDPGPDYDSMQPELMCRLAHELDFQDKTLLLGPGLGNSGRAHDLLAQALNSGRALVLDADALNLIASSPTLQERLRTHAHACILTPHPLEAARLLDCTTHQIQANRLLAAQQLAAKFACTAVLKGSGSVIAGRDGQIVINPTGNPALSTAGTGDVLAGVCVALLAQSWPEWEAALAAVWLHGHAADMLVQQGIGPIGLTASELIPAIRSALNLLMHETAQAPFPAIHSIA